MRSLLLFAAVFLVAPATSAQHVLFVDADATGAANGSSWADAFPDLQFALAVAEAGDEVWVAEGTYRPDESEPVDRDASFVLVSGTRLYGGFDGTETTRDERDPEMNVTVLSGDLGIPDDLSDNAYHVVTASGVDETTVLDGFTVTGGNGNGANPRNRGGGIYAENSSLVVRGCRIVENRVVQTDGFGGGAGAFFGGSESRPRFERVVFGHNNGEGALGGGLWLHEGAGAFIADASFVENRAASGGGLLGREDAGFTVVRTVFVRNVARDGGGGTSISGGEAHLVNVGFYGNVAEPGGTFSSSAGLFSIGSALTFTNVAFVGNTARLGAGFSQGGGTSTLTNVTFAANEAEEFGGIRLGNGGNLAARNTVLWGNSGGEIDATSGTATLSHVLVAGGCPPETTCESILDAVPLFVRPPDPGPDKAWGTADDDYGDLRLQESSPAVDFGLSAFLPPDTFDLDSDGDSAEPLPLDLAGEPRVAGGAVDLGAYERQPPVASDPELTGAVLTLVAYPNPAHGPVTVTLGLTRAQRAEVALFDVRGRRVAVLHDGLLGTGRHTFRLSTASLPSGVYLLRLRGETASGTRRVVVLR